MGSPICRDDYSFNKFHWEKRIHSFTQQHKDKESLFDEIKTQDDYGDLLELKENMIFNSHPTNQFLYDELNRKVLLKLSERLNGCIIMEAVF